MGLLSAALSKKRAFSRDYVVRSKSASANSADSAPKTDETVNVHHILAARLIATFPDKSDYSLAKLYRTIMQMLGNMVFDETMFIRKAVSGTLRDAVCLPPHLVRTYMAEIEQTVSESAMQICAQISGRDLGYLIKQAERGTLTATTHIKTKIELDQTLIAKGMKIVKQSKTLPQSSSLVTNRDMVLPKSIKSDLHDLACDAFLNVLRNEEGQDWAETRHNLDILKRRLALDMVEDPTPHDAVETLKNMVKTDTLHEETLGDALAMNNMTLVYAALAYKSKTTFATVQKIFTMQSAKSIVALCWKAGFSMRFAYQLQQYAGKIPPRQMIYPKDGEAYPLSDDNLIWQLEFLGLQAANAN